MTLTLGKDFVITIGKYLKDTDFIDVEPISVVLTS